MSYPQRSTILIAEDNKDSRLMLHFYLEDLNYKVIEAEDGEEAIKIAQQEQPDLILIDLNIPKVNGITAATVIRNFTELSEVPIIAVSAYGELGMDLFLNIQQLGEGFIGYIPKPIDLADLAEQIEVALFSKEQKV